MMKKKINQIKKKIISYLKNYLKELETTEKSVKKKKKEGLYAKCDQVEHLRRIEELGEKELLPKHEAHREKILKEKYNLKKELTNNDIK